MGIEEDLFYDLLLPRKIELEQCIQIKKYINKRNINSKFDSILKSDKNDSFACRMALTDTDMINTAKNIDNLLENNINK